MATSLSQYRPSRIVTFQLPPDGFDFGVEIHIPDKEVQVKGFTSYNAAKEYLEEVRKLQKQVPLFVRILRRERYFSVYDEKSKKIKPLEPVKGKLYCPSCNDYTSFHNRYGWIGGSAKYCQYCGLSDEDWYTKTLNGLWPSKK